MSGRSPVDVSLVVPVYDERESLPLLVEEIGRALGAWGRWTYEIVAVDDGSTDGSLDVLKALKRDHRALPLVHGMHRFLPTLIKLHGGTVVETPVQHRPRRFGRTKYGMWNRAFRSLADALAVRWMQRRALRYQVREELP